MKTVLIAIKPGMDADRLLDSTFSVLPRGPLALHLASFVSVGTGDDQRERQQSTQRSLDELSGKLRADGHEVSTHVGFSAVNVGSQLIELAAREDVDVMVLGLTKRSRVGKALLGSDAQSVLIHASKPVLSIRLQN